MRILFDHSTPAPLVPFLEGHSITKAKDAGSDRLANGTLLSEAERAGFDISAAKPLSSEIPACRFGRVPL